MVGSVPEAHPTFAVVLGVTQDAGYPHVGCRRACCALAWRSPATRRRVACLGVVDLEGRQRWLIDATPDFPHQLRQLDEMAPFAHLDGIFLTHAHMGHYTGMMYLGREGLDTRRVPVYAMPRMAAFLRANGPWDQLLRLGNIELRPLADQRPLRLNKNLTVTPLQVPHRSEYTETVGFLLQGPRASLLYLPDIDGWERWSLRLEEVLATVDVAYIDGTFFSPAELPGRNLEEIPHPFVVETVRRLRPLPADLRRRVKFIHFNHTNPLLHASSLVKRVLAPTGMRPAVEGERIPL